MKKILRIFTPNKSSLELLKYTATSLISTVGDFAGFYLLYNVCHQPTIAAVIVSQIIGACITFILLYRWVFIFESEYQMWNKLLRFFCTQVVSGLVNALVVWFVLKYFLDNAWLSRVVTSTSLWVVMYLVNKFWVFEKKG